MTAKVANSAASNRRAWRCEPDRPHEAYDRSQLPGVLPIDVSCIAAGAEGTRALLQRIARGLREERARAGARYYDLARHHLLRRAQIAETIRLRAEIQTQKRPPRGAAFCKKDG